MNSIQKAKLTMYMAVRDILTLFATIIANLPNFSLNSKVLTDNIPLIQSAGEQQEFDRSGIKDNKKSLKTTLVNQAADISRKLVAFATNTGNAVLLKEIKYTASELEHSSDADLKNRAQCIHDRANANVTALATYGVTAAILTTFLAAINAFNAAIPKPREGKSDRKLTTEQLKNLYKATDTALDNMDKIVEIVRLTQPAFYAAYKGARKINDAPNGSFAVKGSVIDSLNNPIKGVIVSFFLNGEAEKIKAASNGKPEAVKKTAEKGGFYLKNLAAGVYTVVFKKNGYQDQIVTVAVTDGEMSVLEVQMIKN